MCVLVLVHVLQGGGGRLQEALQPDGGVHSWDSNGTRLRKGACGQRPRGT